jgi:surface carbohydrate biosynthesis protein
MLLSLLNARRKLYKFYKLFIKPKFYWKLPKKSDILIYDACGADALAPYLAEYKSETIFLRGELVNIPCLFVAMFRVKFWKGNPVDAYVDVFIRLVSPSIAVTFIDNSPGFYTISSRFPRLKTVFLQNGRRDDWLDRLPNPPKFHVDYMLFHNIAMGRYHQKFISGSALAVGSLKNNRARKSVDGPGEGVLFVSQFRERPVGGGAFFRQPNGDEVYWEQFYEADARVLRFLSKWCAEKNKPLRIAGCSPDNESAERAFFANCLPGCDWEYFPKSDLYASYGLVDAAELVVFVDSALGYESIGRGKKTAGFSCRGGFVGAETRRFGWPAALPDNGPFWTNELKESEFCRVMNYLAMVSDVEWKRAQSQYGPDLMAFDTDNRQFSALLSQLLPPRESDYCA